MYFGWLELIFHPAAWDSSSPARDPILPFGTQHCYVESLCYTILIGKTSTNGSIVMLIYWRVHDYVLIKWRFPKMCVPLYRWFILEIPWKLIIDDFGGTPILGNLRRVSEKESNSKPNPQIATVRRPWYDRPRWIVGVAMHLHSQVGTSDEPPKVSGIPFCLQKPWSCDPYKRSCKAPFWISRGHFSIKMVPFSRTIKWLVQSLTLTPPSWCPPVVSWYIKPPWSIWIYLP